MVLLYIGGLLLVIALALLLIAGRQRKSAGLPGGRVIYTDTHSWGPVGKPLFDGELGLTGKPDYLVETDGRILPVEVKSGRTPSAPYDSHIFQLAAYCHLVEKAFGVRPPYGILHYPERDFAIDYTPALESALLDLLASLRRDETRRDVPRSHEDEHRCRRCGFKEVCDQRLA
jgi:CRISPR-associated exonuclease Cas4